MLRRRPSQTYANDQVRRRRVLPDRGVDAVEVDSLVDPAADPIVAGVSDEVPESADVFVVARLSAEYPRSPPWRASRRDP